MERRLPGWTSQPIACISIANIAGVSSGTPFHKSELHGTVSCIQMYWNSQRLLNGHILATQDIPISLCPAIYPTLH